MFLPDGLRLSGDLYFVSKRIPPNDQIFMVKNIVFLIFFIALFAACKKEPMMIYDQPDRTIKISEKISIDNGYRITDPNLNLVAYENFLTYLSTSDHFLIVQQRNFLKTTSTDKVVISMRYDIDNDIIAAVKFAYREDIYGIRSTYFILHTAPYYGTTSKEDFARSPNIIYFLKALQNTYGQEIGFHNDLVTLQVIYGISPKSFLKSELEWLRDNNINVYGTAAHGSPYTYLYKYNNSYFWYEHPDRTGAFQNIKKGYETFQIERDNLANYGFEYEGGLLKPDYVFSDTYIKNGKRWNMSQVNFDTIKPGKKVIILLHPGLWD
jgi:hypothetical protein